MTQKQVEKEPIKEEKHEKDLGKEEAEKYKDAPKVKSTKKCYALGEGSETVPPEQE